MSQGDYSRQVAKRQRIKKAALIVGVDIGKAFNAVGFMDKEGNVLGSCAKPYNSREGFEKFINLIEGLKAKHHLRDVLIKMEPTGHYWQKLTYFVKEIREGKYIYTVIDKEQIWSTTQEERDSLRSGYQADQSDFCAVAGQERV